MHQDAEADLRSRHRPAPAQVDGSLERSAPAERTVEIDPARTRFRQFEQRDGKRRRSYVEQQRLLVNPDADGADWLFNLTIARKGELPGRMGEAACRKLAAARYFELGESTVSPGALALDDRSRPRTLA